VHGLWVSRVEASRHAAATVFVSFTGYREDLRAPFVFRSDDGGDTWLAIAHDLPQEPVNVVREHPRNANVLLVGTEMGAYVSIDDGAHWHPLGGGLPRVAVHDLIVHAREPHVLVGTHGRGVWALDASALETLRPEHLGAAFHVLRPSGGVLLRRAFSEGNVGARTWSAANPFVAPTFRYLLAEDSDEKVTVEVLDAAGALVWRKDGPQQAGYHEVAWVVERGGRGPGGGGGPQGGAGRGPQAGNASPRAGTFVVRIARGEQGTTQRFSVIDRRGPAGILGAWPAEDEEHAAAEEEDGEAGAEVEAASELEPEARSGDVRANTTRRSSHR
jgi:hypothetical protein